MYRPVTFGELRCTSLSMTSDRSKKTNIKKCENALDTLDKLDGVTWDWKLQEYCGGKSSGIIADELEDIEELKYMLQGEKGDYSIQYNCLHGYYIEAIKDLRQKVKSLESETAELRQTVRCLQEQQNDVLSVTHPPRNCQHVQDIISPVSSRFKRGGTISSLSQNM